MKRLRTPLGQLAGLWAAASLILLALWPWWHTLLDTVPACRFRQLTHVPCFTCGSTRAFHALMRGDILHAFSINPLTTLGCALFFVGGVGAALWLMGLGPQQTALSRKTARIIAVVCLAALVANWLYLLLSPSG